MTETVPVCAVDMAGETLFYQGKPCKKGGHNGLRYKSTGACVKCMAEYSVVQRAKRAQLVAQ